jgi:hypothetical protein
MTERHCDTQLNCKILRDYLDKCNFSTAQCEDCGWIDKKSKFHKCANCEAYLCEDCEYYLEEQDDFYCKTCNNILTQ